MDEKIDEHSRSYGRTLGELQSKIFALHKKIGEIESPRDDSLDNCVVVWCSQAFASAGAGAGAASGAATTPGESSVPSVCNILEDSGLTIRRCSEPEEAISRARDLQVDGQLRCLIVGGDEKGLSCGPSCVKSHEKKNCIKCGEAWNRHNGHNCRYGGRGSWLFDDNSSATRMTSMQIMNSLTDLESQHARLHGAMPASRTAIYCAHMSIKEEERMQFWKLGTTVTDDSKQLIKWVLSIPPWNAHVDVEDFENETATTGDIPGPPKLNREVSFAEKSTLLKYKAELEELEEQKLNLTNDDESTKKKLQQLAADKNSELELSVEKRMTELSKAENEFKLLIVQMYDDDKIILQDVDQQQSDIVVEGSKSSVGPHSGRDAAIALAWLEVYKDVLPSLEREKYKAQLTKYYYFICNELSFLKQMALAAKVVAHVTSPTHKKLLNLCHNWLSTFLPHVLAKVNRVSFGLLSAEDCKTALLHDPHVPRSRLKLAVPFIGKDVPSKSSEFAHPDIIIGLTILAYR